MTNFRIALLQARFRSSFPEKIPAIARVARPRKTMHAVDYEFNHRLLLSLVREAAAKGAQLAVGPESYLDGWSFERGSLPKISQSLRDPRIAALRRTARELHLWLCIAFLERAGQAIYNSAILISGAGRIAGHYRKTHETKDVLAKLPYRLGNALPVFRTPWGKVGILICHDRWYPENARTLRLKGADFIVNPTATAVFHPRHKYHDIHRSVQRSHAYGNGLYWASCNSANHGGHSVVIAPDGNVIAEGSSGQEIVIADLKARPHSRYDFVSNLRPELYSHARNR